LARLPCGHDRRIGLAVVQRSHDANAREYRRAAERRDQDQGFHRLPENKVEGCGLSWL